MALVLSVGAGACKKVATGVPGGGTPNFDAAVFQECTSVCIRPGDCAQAFNDDGICPVGFLCALHYSCSKD